MGIMAPSAQQLTGQASELLSALSEHIFLHPDVIQPFEALRHAAALKGFQLSVASGYRSFERQLHIWNSKAGGQRPILDRDGFPLEIAQLSDRELIFAILRWSALPGASRHHWGTDMDVWDSAAVAEDYRLQLVPEEYSTGGPFFPMAQWLATAEVKALGFVRPYSLDRGGVAPEAWHLSYAPVAARFESCLNMEILATVVATADMLLKDTVLQHLEEIYERFVVCKIAT